MVYPNILFYTVKNNSVQNPLLYKISISKGFHFCLFTKPFTCISYIICRNPLIP